MISRNTLSFDLQQAGILDADQLKIIEIEQARTGKADHALIKELGFITQSLLQEFIAKRNNVSFIDLKHANINKHYARVLDKEYCQKHKIILFDIIESNENIAQIAMAQEIDIHTKDNLKQKLKMPIKFFLCDENVILETLEYVFNESKDVSNWIDLLDQEYKCDESFATRLIYDLIVHCIKEQVSDIHIEPEEYFVRIRLRKDGLLKPLCVFPKEKWTSLCVRIKMLANMDITQSFMPQDGRFDFTAFGRKVDLRISSRPIIFGENIVIRLLDTHSKAAEIEELGYTEQNIDQLNKILRQTSGVFIVTGPTGSGKSTLLFSMLKKLAKPSVSIATIEDPVEYRYTYLRQTDINTYKNMSFANALKSILRQDPDIVSISEIRDSETAVMAMRAAMTGRMLFTTLHTNDIFGIFDRLIDLGVDKRVLINHLNGIATQRLVRKVCKCCCKKRLCLEEEKNKLKVSKLKHLSNDPKSDETYILDAVGCEKCNYSGYHGRIAVAQVLFINQEIKDLLYKHSIEKNSIEEVKKMLYEDKSLSHAFLSGSFLSLEDELRLRVLNQETTLEEAERVLFL